MQRPGSRSSWLTASQNTETGWEDVLADFIEVAGPQPYTEGARAAIPVISQ